ncbi:RpiB/LacA/LacB family sugar-phosphate isomerase [Candidatus Saccharibacteria bacterium]|jgi:ribose 5-phosphate isomerase B|nr:RpiB/LacA/LacB family sugar-phosphate isomerase [Candidatus Saccharibacteria bacterium]
MKLFFGADHAGFELKNLLRDYAIELGYEVEDLGAHEFDNDDNYPDFILPVARAVAKNSDSLGVILGGSGQGEAMAANRIPGIRATTFYGPQLPVQAVDSSGRLSEDDLEMVRLSRSHNAANVLSIAGRFVAPDTAKKALKLWLGAETGVKPRYQARIDQVEQETT